MYAGAPDRCQAIRGPCVRVGGPAARRAVTGPSLARHWGSQASQTSGFSSTQRAAASSLDIPSSAM
jgi:hypothetical protein